MKRNKEHILLLLLWCLLIMFPASAQPSRSLNIHFTPVANNILLKQASAYYQLTNGKDSIEISALRFYISGISFFQDEQEVWEETNSFHLVDLSEPDRMNIALSIPQGLHYNRIRFNLGIDSITNAGGARGGDLDATKGMYWAWHSGYINFKLEGSSPVCKTRKHAFQFHLGGFRDGTYCMQQIDLEISEKIAITIGLDILRFLKDTDLATQAEIMTPGPDAVALSKSAARMFYILSTP